MSSNERHVDDRIPAYLDGELKADEAERVLAHCRACASCGRVLDESTRVMERLRAAAAPDPARSFWPYVRAEIARAAERRLGPAFAFGATAAVAAGIALGLLVGTVDRPATAISTEETIWTTVGSTMFGDSQVAFGDSYLSFSDDGGS